MDLRFTGEEQAFRAEVRAFIRAHLPAGLSKKLKEGRKLSRVEQTEWTRILHQKGWSAPMSPRAPICWRNASEMTPLFSVVL